MRSYAGSHAHAFLHPQSSLLVSRAQDIRTAYLENAADLQPFFQYPLQQPDFAQIIADKGREDIDRETLAQVIADQYRGLSHTIATQQSLIDLAQPNSFTLTTGHQLVLFGGPLFTIYKVVSTIKMAEQLRVQFPEQRFVPIFWIHTEDHDFEEINHYFTSFTEKRQYHGTFHTQVGSHVLEDSITELYDGHFPDALNEAFQPGRSLADAFRAFFHELFKDYGLLMLDASDPRLKARFREVMQVEVAQHVARQQVDASSLALKRAGFKQQIHAREINLFYVDAEGRDRVMAQNGHYKIHNRETEFSPEAIRELIDNHPERFSPNVSLRPLYQEMILPNLAYFGGWGEISYWMQLKGVFDHFGVNFPLILPRFSATVFPAEKLSEWMGMGFAPADIRKPLHDLYRQYMPQVWDSNTFDELEERILADLESLRAYIEEDVSPTLARSADALRTKNLRFLKNIRKKAHRIVRQEQPEAFRRIDAFKQEIYPDGTVQERVWSLATVGKWRTPAAFLSQVYAACDPLDYTHKVLVVGD